MAQFVFGNGTNFVLDIHLVILNIVINSPSQGPLAAGILPDRQVFVRDAIATTVVFNLTIN